MPVKSNKFDFTNRTSTGVKMGQIVGHALEKEVDKMLKDAEKQTGKFRKQSSAGKISHADEICSHTTHLDIKVPGKNLGDDGTFALIEGLQNALATGTDQIRLVLEDLNLASNDITTASLRRLAPVIVMAGNTLRTLNLSHNNIQVSSEEQAEDWECFLSAFEHCSAFCRLDLTSNEHLGSKALEILTKLHVRSDHIPPIATNQRRDWDKYLGSQSRRESDDSAITTNVSSIDDCNCPGSELRSGLRSIAYMIVDNVGMDDSGALWLSYLVEDHFYPSQLVDDPGSVRGEGVQQAGQNDGIDWSGNESSLSKDGHFVLRKAEQIRRQFLEENDTNSIMNIEIELDPEDVRNRSHYTGGRGGETSSRDPASGEQDLRLLESGRRKLQRLIIAEPGGAKSVDVWRAALRVVSISRMFTYSIGHRSTTCPRGTVDPRPSPEGRIHHRNQTTNGNSHTSAEKESNTQTNHVSSDPKRSTRHGSHTSRRTDTAKTRSETGAVSKTRHVDKEPIAKRNHHASKAVDACRDIEEDLRKLQMPGPQMFLEAQEDRIKAITTGDLPFPFRDDRNPSGLPRSVIKRIISFLLTSSERAAMTEDQIDKALQWGQDRASLRKELEWLKDHESVQKMRLLESIGCMEYAPE